MAKTLGRSDPYKVSFEPAIQGPSPSTLLISQMVQLTEYLEYMDDEYIGIMETIVVRISPMTQATNLRGVFCAFCSSVVELKYNMRCVGSADLHITSGFAQEIQGVLFGTLSTSFPLVWFPDLMYLTILSLQFEGLVSTTVT